MSIFDQYSDLCLPGDKRLRKIKTDVSEYSENSEQESIGEKPKKSFWPFYSLSLIILVVLVAQLLNLQIGKGSFNRFLAEGNRIRQRSIQAPRGIIYDKEGISLTSNDASFSLEVYPLDLPKNEKERGDFFEKLSGITQIPVEEIKNAINAGGVSRADPVVLKENIDRESALLLETRIINLPGVAIGKNPVRNYKEVTGLAQILGYVGKISDQELQNHPEFQMNEIIGKDGIEKSYQEFLKGQNGINEFEVDSRGRAQRLISSTTPKPGNSLTLTLDAALEEKMAESLSSALSSASSQAGAIVAIDPKTGGVLGMVSLPTYDNNGFSKGMSLENYQKLLNDETKPMLNRAISGNYPSGSTIKPLVASAGLQEGIITENTTIEDEGEIKVSSWIYPDWKAHGLVDIRKAIAQSCNVFFYAVGGGWDKIKGLGVEKLRDYLAQFGFGKKLGIDLPGESDGLLPSPEWKEKVKHETWYLGDTYHMAIGQGDVIVTPLQMASSIAAIANGGELLRPHIVSQIKDLDGKMVKENTKQVLASNFVSNDNLQIVREGMRQAVTSGSASALNDLPVMAAAKTGTAQFGNEGKTHAWMATFAPYQDPEIVVVVLVEGGGEGYATAGPVAEDVLNWYFTR